MKIDVKINLKSKSKRRAVLFIFIPLSIPITFLLYFMVRKEINEHFIYGIVSEAIIIDKEYFTSTGSGGGGLSSIEYEMKDIKDDKTYFEKFSVNPRKASSLRKFRNEVELHDTVKIKIRNKSQAKIIEYKNQEVQPYVSYFNLFWYYLFILFLIALVIFPYYVLIKYKK